MPDDLLSMQGIRKSFGSVAALCGVDFRVGRNEIVGLLGDNGAGKSTLVKVLSGVLRPDAGEMRVRGGPVRFGRYDVAAARRMGIETVYQERALAEKQPLWRNMFVGRHLVNRLGLIRVREEKERTARILSELAGLPDAARRPEALISELSGGERQGLAIGRAMYFESDLVILDEPTTALSLSEVEKVLFFVSGIRERGKSAVFISHSLAHVYEAADRFVILDRGRVAAELDRKETGLAGLSRVMIDLVRRNGGRTQ